MLLTSVFGLTGCDTQGNMDRGEVAEKLLKEKYNEEFIIYAMGKSFGTLSNDTYTVVCSSKNNPDLKFEAEISKDGSYMFDEYVSRKVSAKIEESLTNSLSRAYKNFKIKVGAVGKTTDSDNSNMSIEDYLKIENKKDAGFAIYVVIDKESLTGVSGTALYTELSSMFNSLPKLNGSIRVYFTTDDVLQKTSIYLKENANVDSKFQELLKESKNIYSKFNESVLDISSHEFEVKFKEI